MSGSTTSGTEAALLFQKRGGVATLTLNRPSARNAVTAASFACGSRSEARIHGRVSPRRVFIVPRRPRRRHPRSTCGPSFSPKSVAKSLELPFLGDLVDATEALRLGLVNRVVAPDALADATAELAERLAQGPTLAFGFAKEAVYAGATLPFESLLDLEARKQKVAGRSHDAREGIRAFRERRTPEFRGR